MSLLESIFLGIIQGLTEFLPISSSGHLILAAELFGINSDLSFDVFLHFGTLIAVVAVYKKSILSLFTKENSMTLLYLFLASIPTFAIALVVKLFVPYELMKKLLPIGFAITIAILTTSHFLAPDKNNRPSILSSIVVGVVQGIAVIPGLSRSGSTISAMNFFGVKREKSAEFSFLLSIPVILASVAVEGYEALFTPMNTSWFNVAVGVVIAAVVGMLAIKIVQKTLKKSKFIGFAFYLIIPFMLSILIL